MPCFFYRNEYVKLHKLRITLVDNGYVGPISSLSHFTQLLIYFGVDKQVNIYSSIAFIHVLYRIKKYFTSVMAQPDEGLVEALLIGRYLVALLAQCHNRTCERQIRILLLF